MNADENYAWVDAAPFAAHARRVMADSGLPWRVVALAVGIPSPTMKGLLTNQRRRLPAAMARRLLDFDALAVATLRREHVPARKVARHVVDLREAGFSWGQVAQFCQLSEFEARMIASGRGTCDGLTSLRALAAAEAHGLAHPESRRVAA